MSVEPGGTFLLRKRDQCILCGSKPGNGVLVPGPELARLRERAAIGRELLEHLEDTMENHHLQEFAKRYRKLWEEA